MKKLVMKRYKVIITSDLEVVSSSKESATEWFQDNIKNSNLDIRAYYVPTDNLIEYLKNSGTKIIEKKGDK